PEDPLFPLYVKQSDDDGAFSLTNLARGTYRLFAFRDVDGRLPYDPDADLLAVPTVDLEIAQARDRWRRVQVGVAPRDTIGPRIRSASARDLRHVQVRFSEPPAREPMPAVALTPHTPSEEGGGRGDAGGRRSGTEVPPPEVLRSYFPIQSPANMVLLVSGLEEGQRYRVRLLYAADALGNPHRPAPGPVTFSAPAREDTARPRLVSHTPPDSSRSLNARSVVQLTFSTEIDTSALGPWSLEGPGTPELERTWLDPMTVELRPAGGVEEDAWYTLAVPEESLVSWTGRTGPGEEVRIAWRGAPLPGAGWLMITVEGEELSDPARYRLVLEGSTPGAPRRTLMVREGPGRFQSPELPVGEYILWGWHDADGDGTWDAGSVDPFEPSEVMNAITDSLYVNDSFYSEVDPPLYLGPPIRSLVPADTAASALPDTVPDPFSIPPARPGPRDRP
ncbi:MAG: Ig-like domain-containing protein, partial [bacterium]